MASEVFRSAGASVVAALEEFLARRSAFHGDAATLRVFLQNAIADALELASAPPAPPPANVTRLTALRLHLDGLRDFAADQAPSLGARRAAQQAIAQVDRLARSIAGFPTEGD